MQHCRIWRGLVVCNLCFGSSIYHDNARCSHRIKKYIKLPKLYAWSFHPFLKVSLLEKIKCFSRISCEMIICLCLMLIFRLIDSTILLLAHYHVFIGLLEITEYEHLHIMFSLAYGTTLSLIAFLKVNYFYGFFVKGKCRWTWYQLGMGSTPAYHTILMNCIIEKQYYLKKLMF